MTKKRRKRKEGWPWRACPEWLLVCWERLALPHWRVYIEIERDR